jgi:hypothetical protein
VAYGRHGRRPAIGQWGRCLEDVACEAATEACLQRFCPLGRARGGLGVLSEGGRGRVSAGTGRWGRGCWEGGGSMLIGGVGDGGEKEEGRRDLGQDLPQGSPLPCVHP